MRILFCCLFCCCLLTSSEHQFRRAEALQLEGRYREAAKTYRRCFETRPPDLEWSVPALINYFGCLRAIDDDEARTAFTRDASRFLFEPLHFDGLPLSGERALEAMLWKPWAEEGSDRSWRPTSFQCSYSDDKNLPYHYSMRLTPQLRLLDNSTMTGGRVTIIDAEGGRLTLDHVPGLPFRSAGIDYEHGRLEVSWPSGELLTGPLRLEGSVTLRQPAGFSYLQLPLDRPGAEVSHGQRTYTYQGREDGAIVYTCRDAALGTNTGIRSSSSAGSLGDLSLIDAYGTSTSHMRLSASGEGDTITTRLEPHQGGPYTQLRIRVESAWSERQLDIALDGIATP